MAVAPKRNKRPFRMIAGVSVLDDLADGYMALGDPGMGNMFFVNGGSDGPTNDDGGGLDKDHPLQTIGAALDLCVSGNDDYIIVLNYGSNGRGSETWPIEVDKDFVHIIGARSNVAGKWPAVKPDETANAFTVSGQRCEFANLEIGGVSTGSGIEVLTSTWACFVHDCHFGVTGATAGTHGVYVASGAGAPYLTVVDCEFGYALTGDGVRVAGNATRGWIGRPGHGNLFREVAGIAINISGSALLSGICDNRFSLLALTVGDAITMSSGSANTMIDGNRVGYGKTTSAKEFFVDAGTANHWGLNYVGDAVALPA